MQEDVGSKNLITNPLKAGTSSVHGVAPEPTGGARKRQSGRCCVQQAEFYRPGVAAQGRICALHCPWDVFPLMHPALGAVLRPVWVDAVPHGFLLPDHSRLLLDPSRAAFSPPASLDGSQDLKVAGQRSLRPCIEFILKSPSCKAWSICLFARSM